MNDILEKVYIDDLLIYNKLINRRQIAEHKMQLAIATNPQTKRPKELWETLNRQERTNEGREYIDAQLDVAGLERFKKTIAQGGSKIAVK